MADCHFTYQAPAGENLQQGDLISKTAPVQALLDEIHPHYNRKEDYGQFIVLTQTCDLVKRDGRPCKSKYISLAAVRPLSLVLEREIARHQEAFDLNARVCSHTKRQIVEQFLTRILNNNEPEYFYVEPEPAFGISEASCAFLRLSVAIRAEEHYKKILDARLVSLTDVFQAKLGWLVGNMYSRVGTVDWVPDNTTEEEFRAKVKKHLDEVVLWVDAEQLKVARKAAPAGDHDVPTLREIVVKSKAAKKKDRVLDAVIKVARAQGVITDEDAEKKLRSRLDNDPEFSSSMK